MQTRFDLRVDGPAAMTTSVVTELTNRLADRGDVLHVPQTADVLEEGSGQVQAEVSGEHAGEARDVLNAILDQIPDAHEVITVV